MSLPAILQQLCNFSPYIVGPPLDISWGREKNLLHRIFIRNKAP